MSINDKIFIKLFFLIFFSFSFAHSEEIKNLGKFKDWEAFVILNESGKVCFAHSIPILQSPKKDDREARLFVTFRPSDKISDEVSTTSGYEYNSQNSIVATSGKSKYKFDLVQNYAAFISNTKIEKKIIKRMKKASRIMVRGFKQSGSQTIDHYSLMGFTKAYDAAKQSCK